MATFTMQELKEYIPFYGIYEEKEKENPKLATAKNSLFRYSKGADVAKTWKAHGWIPPTSYRVDFLFKENRIASGLPE